MEETAPARFSASASDPPMRPTPMTASDLMRRTSGLRERAPELGEEPRVVLRQADRHPQVLWHAVAGDRPHDDAGAQQPLVGRIGGGADAHGDEIAARRDEVEAKFAETVLELD